MKTRKKSPFRERESKETPKQMMPVNLTVVLPEKEELTWHNHIDMRNNQDSNRITNIGITNTIMDSKGIHGIDKPEIIIKPNIGKEEGIQLTTHLMNTKRQDTTQYQHGKIGYAVNAVPETKNTIIRHTNTYVSINTIT